MPINLANIARNSAKGAGANIVKNAGALLKSDRGEGALKSADAPNYQKIKGDFGSGKKNVLRYPLDLGNKHNKYSILFKIYLQDNGQIKELEEGQNAATQTQKEKGAPEQAEDTKTGQIDSNIKTTNNNNTNTKQIEDDYQEYRGLASFGQIEKEQLKSGTNLSKGTKQYFASERRVGNKQSGLLKQETIDKVAEYSRKYNEAIKENQTLAKKNEDLSKEKTAPTPPPQDGTGDDKNKPDDFKTKAMSLRRNATFKHMESVALYFPAKVSNNTSVNLAETDVSNFLTAAAGGVMGNIEALTGGGTINMGNLKSALGNFEALLQNQIEQSLPGFRETGEILSGRGIRSDRTEVAFKGVDRRTFSFDFKFMPRSEEEAIEVKNIIKTFRIYQMPSLSTKMIQDVESKKGITKDPVNLDQNTQLGNIDPSETSKKVKSSGKIYYDSPGFFDIQFMVNAQENNYPIKMGRCFLKSVNVTYGSDRTAFFKSEDPNSSPFTEVTMQLSFQEVETLYRGRVAKDNY